MDDIKDIKRLLLLMFRYNEIEKQLETAIIDSVEWHMLLAERSVIDGLIRDSCFEYIDELNNICMPKFREIGKRFDKRRFQ